MSQQRTLEITVADQDYTVGIDQGKADWVVDAWGNEPSAKRTKQVLEEAEERLEAERELAAMKTEGK